MNAKTTARRTTRLPNNMSPERAAAEQRDRDERQARIIAKFKISY